MKNWYANLNIQGKIFFYDWKIENLASDQDSTVKKVLTWKESPLLDLAKLISREMTDIVSLWSELAGNYPEEISIPG